MKCPAVGGAERDALINELAGSIVTEAQAQFGDDLMLVEVWREAALEAACARLDAVDLAA